jgi:5-methyltetrahydrofolate--homocysteine methyltransferase
MIIIGEKLNSTILAIRPAMEQHDKEAIADLARKQIGAGATFIDINAGMFPEDEPERLAWLAGVVQEAVDAPLSIDSPNPAAIRRALEVNNNPRVLINSITAEPKRFEAVLPLVTEFKASVIALCMGSGGIPQTVDERIRIGEELVEKLVKAGVEEKEIYLDPLVLPISTGTENGNIALEAIRRMREEFPKTHIACGLSNISFHLPNRQLINQAFLVAAVQAGMDGAILDPLDERLMSMLYASEALFGKDKNCKNYLKHYRTKSSS